MEHRGLASLVLKTLVLLAATVPVCAASHEHRHENVPVFVIGADGGLSPFVMRRDSKEFRELVFPRLAEAMALGGFRAIGEAPFRAKYNVDGVVGESCSRWDSLDFLHFADSVAVDEAGNTAPYLVAVDVWQRRCRDDETHVCLDFGASIHETASGERITVGGLSEEVRFPIPFPCDEACRWEFWQARSEELFHPLGAEVASRISEHMSARTAPARQ